METQIKFGTRLIEQRLAVLGIESVEQLVGAAAAAGPELSRYLRVDLDELISRLPVAAAIPASALKTMDEAVYSLGVALDHISLPEAAFAIPIAEQAATMTCANLVGQLPPIRNQAQRGTCVAHAALASFEYLLSKSGSFQDLSEQFLYWNCKRNDGIPTQAGTWLGVAMPLLQRDGCCDEATWPYVGHDIPGNEGQAPPPPGAQRAALTFRPSQINRIAPTSVPDYRTELAMGRVVAFSIPVFNSWLGSRYVAYMGDITLPIPGEVRVGGHAMAIVGCLDQPDKPEIGGGRFILRNSWGGAWGINSPHGAGYGTIPYAYIARFGAEAYSVS